MNSSDNTPSCFLYSKWLYKKKTKTQPLSRNGFPNLFLFFFFSFFRYLPPSSNHHRVNNPFESLSTKRNRGVAIYSFYDVGPQRKNKKNQWLERIWRGFIFSWLRSFEVASTHTKKKSLPPTCNKLFSFDIFPRWYNNSVLSFYFPLRVFSLHPHSHSLSLNLPDFNRVLF